MKKIIGHTEIMEPLLTAAHEQQLHPGLLFSGPEGIGKRTAAMILAQTVLCESKSKRGPCGQCESCLLFEAHNHPDFFLFDPAQKEQSSVDFLRKLLHQLSMQAFRGHAKVVVIDNADAFSVDAANVFLKNLEEPRPQQFFILVASNSSRLPITIRSRVQRWEFQPLSKDEIQSILQEQPDHGGSLHSDSFQFYEYADGSITQLQKFAQKASLIKDLQRFVEAVLERRLTECLVFAQTITKEKDALAEKISLLIPIVRHQLRFLVSQVEGGAEHFTEGEADRIGRFSLLLNDLIVSQYLIFERNVSPLMVLTDIVKRVVADQANMSRTALQSTLGEAIAGY